MFLSCLFLSKISYPRGNPAAFTHFVFLYSSSTSFALAEHSIVLTILYLLKRLQIICMLILPLLDDFLKIPSPS
ncbi:MAG: hypothetical protein COT22_04165 [Ignavibacteria bacterium CG08_land_8_20_14_0_20_37_9]|nr:MAG: hypothetical protein COT22_04165 [Ignavibacteria bacterium CG08_land_8_20_14_0_20_37_9]PJC57815.1 MAG: hypothetical protein CO025_11440 [Ignavibacteria bacterium CG_4_9_14_0_2_um_filter_37_13]